MYDFKHDFGFFTIARYTGVVWDSPMCIELRFVGKYNGEYCSIVLSFDGSQNCNEFEMQLGDISGGVISRDSNNYNKFKEDDSSVNIRIDNRVFVLFSDVVKLRSDISKFVEKVILRGLLDV
jgi:hypothetical protein